jgi:predicted ATPase
MCSFLGGRRPMHLKRVTILSEKYPTVERYPFNLKNLRETRSMEFDTPISFFVGENGTGKSTLLRAISHRCGIFIWEPIEGLRYEHNPYEEQLYKYIDIEWTDGKVPGSFFASEIFQYFAKIVDERAIVSSKNLKYYGGKSLITQSHGQSHMAFFQSRYQIKGIYFLDEPENALSPRTQLEFLKVLKKMRGSGHAQFIIATHSPILLSLPGAKIYSFDLSPIEQICYEKTEHYRVYSDFFINRDKYLDAL